MIYWFRRPRVNPSYQPYAREGQAVVGPAATGSLANAIGRGKTAPGSRACFSPAFRARAWVPNNLARRIVFYWFRRPRCGARRSGRLEGAPRFIPSLLFTRARARARPWSDRKRPTGSLADASGALKTAPCLRRAFTLARGCRTIWRGEKQGRLLTNRPCSSLVYEESDSKERLRVSNWIVQRLYNYAVQKTVEL